MDEEQVPISDSPPDETEEVIPDPIDETPEPEPEPEPLDEATEKVVSKRLSEMARQKREAEDALAEANRKLAEAAKAPEPEEEPDPPVNTAGMPEYTDEFWQLEEPEDFADPTTVEGQRWRSLAVAAGKNPDRLGYDGWVTLRDRHHAAVTDAIAKEQRAKADVDGWVSDLSIDPVLSPYLEDEETAAVVKETVRTKVRDLRRAGISATQIANQAYFIQLEADNKAKALKIARYEEQLGIKKDKAERKEAAAAETPPARGSTQPTRTVTTDPMAASVAEGFGIDPKLLAA